MSTIPTVLKLLAASYNVAKRSGSIIRQVLSSGELGIVEKENKNDLQTEADRAVQRCIVSSLYKQFPNITVIGEEEGLDEIAASSDEYIENSLSQEVLSHACPPALSSVADTDIVVWVDPLDGTSEFTEGLLDHVTVLIGIACKGRAVGGVIHQPYYNYKTEGATDLGRTIWGLEGLGSFGCDDKTPPKQGNIITTTRSHSNKTVVDSIQACNPTEVVRVGGAGHKVMLLIDGLVHAYVFASPGCKKWDTCAPEAILRAKGGRLTDMHGSDLQYDSDVQRKNSAGVLATLDASQHQWYLERIPQSVKDVLQPVLAPSGQQKASS